MIRIAIADDHELVRAGFQRVLERHPDMKVVGLAASGSEVAPLLREHEVDVLLLDISMPGPSFLTLMEQVQAQWPDVVVLVLSMHPEKTWAVRALRAGAAGYITKQRPA
ncbi:MAG: response regulator transcription factor, partial [Gemmatimonadales bacterium]